jgi:hypothetical protein
MRARECSPYPELYSRLDESKRAKKTLELAIHKSRAKELKRYLSLLHPTWIENKPTLGWVKSRLRKKPEPTKTTPNTNKSADARQSSRSIRQKEVTKRKLSYKTIRRRPNFQNHHQKKEKTLFGKQKQSLMIDLREWTTTIRNYSDLRKNKQFTRHTELLATLIT